LPHKDKIIAIGLDSAELGNPPGEFKAVFDYGRAEGFLTVAHAGEEGPPEYIWEALDVLKAQRIDHGVRCLEDAQLVKRLAEEQIPLTVCPLSNWKLCVVKSLAAHPLKELLDRGICVTINSDDPAYFGGYLEDNYAQAASALRLSTQEIATMAKNSFTASFIADKDKQRYCREIDEILVAAKV